MSRKLIKQMRNEWRANLWLVIELFFVSVVLWYMVDYIVGVNMLFNEPMGFNTKDVCRIEVGRVPQESSAFDRQAGAWRQAIWEQANTLRQKLMDNEYVEAAGICDYYAVPFMGGAAGNVFTMQQDSTVSFALNHAYITPEMIDVLQYGSPAGLTHEEMKQILSDGRIIVPSVMPDEIGVKPEYVLGKPFYDQNNTIVVPGGFFQIQRRTREESLFDKKKGFSKGDKYYYPYTVLELLSDRVWDGGVNSICVRVKPGQGRKFVDYVKENMGNFHVGNIFISSVRMFDDIEADSIHRFTNQIMRYTLLILFFVSVIFLGIFGTFWFRTRQRISEIGIRKVAGATSRNIIDRFMSEGLILLTTGIVPAILVCVMIAKNELNFEYRGFLVWWRMAISIGIVYVVLAIVVALGILFPAMKAMKLEAATALKDE